jgi:hypothetical protein
LRCFFSNIRRFNGDKPAGVAGRCSARHFFQSIGRGLISSPILSSSQRVNTGAVIERVERKDMPPAARQAMAEGFQRMLDRREIVFTGERNAEGKPIYRSMIYEGDRDPRREN